MPIATKATALLTALRRDDIAGMSPAARAQLVNECRRVAELAERPDTPKTGVLSELAGDKRQLCR